MQFPLANSIRTAALRGIVSNRAIRISGHNVRAGNKA
jgi:hypothetical protein